MQCRVLSDGAPQRFTRSGPLVPEPLRCVLPSLPKMNRPALKSTLSLLSGSLLVTALPLLAVAVANRPPAEVLEHSQRLTGEWKAFESQATDLGGPNLDDSDWKKFTVPGGFGIAGFKGPRLWLRRTVDWNGPEGPAFFLLGNLRNGLGELYVNGVSVGRNESSMRNLQPDWTTIAGWEIPPGLLHQGSNVLALRLDIHDVDAGGIIDQRVLLGPAAGLQEFYARIRSFKGLMASGALALCLFLMVLLAALLPSAADERERTRFKVAMGLAGGVAVYNVAATGLLTILVRPPIWAMGPLAAFAMGVVATGLAVFTDLMLIGRRSLATRVTVIMSVIAVIGTFVTPDAMKPFIITLALTLMYFSVMAVRAVARRPTGWVPSIGFAVIFVNVAAISDLLGNLGLSSIPALFSQAVTDAAMIGGGTIVAEFIKLSRRNQVLSSSLSITNGDLGAALVRAQESTRLKNELLATVSHELRTPLNSIINVPEGLLEDFVATCGRCQAKWTLGQNCPTCGTSRDTAHVEFTGDPAHTARYLGSIRSAGSQLASVVNDLLDYSRLTASRFALALEPIELGPFLDTLRRTLEPLAEQRRLQLVFPQNVPSRPLRADPTRLRQVLLNLFSNALKFTPEGGQVSLIVEAEGDTCWLRVKDTGIGIAPENHRIIFESFRQVDGTHTRKFGGSGLGLSIAHELVALHHGSIAVQSKLGEGSTFSVGMPFNGPASVPAPARAAVDTSHTVLIVEDDATTLETIRLALRPLGCSLVGATDAESARTLIHELKPSAVVLDVMLASMSGLELLQHLRKAAETKDLKVVVTSAYYENEAAARALGASWVPKPWNGAELFDAVASSLSTVAAPAEFPTVAPA